MPLSVKSRKFILQGNLYLSLFFLLTFSAQTQEGSTPISLIQSEIINQEEGLSQGMICDITQDSYGYLWIATKDGLNRYDGKSFKVYRPDPLDPNSLSDGFITCLFTDSKGRLWIGTFSGGLNLYNHQTDQFIHFKHSTSNRYSISSNHIVRISEFPDGRLLIENKNGELFDILIEGENDSTAFTFERLSHKYPSVGFLLQRLYEIKAQTIDSKGNIWIYEEDTIHLLAPSNNGKNLIHTPYVISNYGYRSYNDTKGQTNHIKNFHDKSAVYVHDNAQTLYLFHPETKTFRKFLVLKEPFLFSGKCFIDRENTLWNIQKDGSILRVALNTRKHSISRLAEKGNIPLFKQHTYFNVHQDNNNNYWLGTPGGGIFKLKDNSDKFQEIQNNNISSLKNFRLNSRSNTNLFDLELQKKWKELKIDSFLQENHLQWTSSIFKHAAIDEEGVFWIPLEHQFERTCFLFGFQAGKETIKITLPLAPNNFGFIPWIIFIDHKNELWFVSRAANYIGPLCRLNRKDHTIKEFPFPSSFKVSDYPFVSDWLEDEESVFWFATLEGIFSFNTASHKWKHFKSAPKDDHSLSTNRTFSILPDTEQPDSFIWVGTDGGGLNKLNKFTGACRRFNTEDGFSNNVIYGLLSDHKNNLWFSTNLGLNLFDPRKKVCRSFGKADGLPFLEFNRYAYSKDKQGLLYFEGEGKIIRVNPVSFYHEREASPVVINALKVFNTSIEYNNIAAELDMEISLPKAIQFCEEIELPYEASIFSLGFTMLDLSSPSDNSFEYKMEGLNETWIKAGKEQEATFTNLNPGRYTFQVRGKNSQDVWSQTQELKIKILPPWWKEWWFQSLCILSFIALLYLIYRYRLNQVLKIERMRNDIAQDLHDEIGSTLSSISLYSAVLQNTGGKLSSKSKSILDKIIDSTSSVMANMNDIVWTIKADNDNFETVINRLRAFSVDITETQHIELSFEVSNGAEDLSLSMKQRKNIYLIFKEAINNAVKYADASSICITIQVKDNILVMQAIDNGKGFSYKKEMNTSEILGGNGIEGMFYRSKQINTELAIDSSNGKGTCIELRLHL
jgi:signal transduction histidine kinase/ligand-binding sensor domain-containing protein